MATSQRRFVARQLPLAALPTAPRMARAFVEHAASAWNIKDEPLETAKLLMSEFATNAVVQTGRTHGTSMPGPAEHVAVIQVRVELCAGGLRVAVWDSDASSVPVVQDPTDDAESGRGLYLVAELASNWGHYFPPAGGKVVWAGVALAEVAGDAAVSTDPKSLWWPLPKRQAGMAGCSRSAEDRTSDVGQLETALWDLQKQHDQQRGLTSQRS